MTARRHRRAFVLGGLLAALGAVLQACREEEQGRIVRYEPGTYRGPARRPLPQQRLGELEERAHKQDF
jgi:hypothetical protein